MGIDNLMETAIENRIYCIRGIYVMIDRDLAELYEVETKVLNQAVKRNIQRFPEQFRFQLTENEMNDFNMNFDCSRSQFVTLNNQNKKIKLNRGKNIKYLPYVFTEQGVSMLSAVLRSETAIMVSIQIMNTFVLMRKHLSSNQGLLQRINGIEKKQLETDEKFEKVFKALETNDNLPRQGVFFEGQVFDAYILASKIIQSAKNSIILVDNYIDETVLVLLAKKNKNVKASIFTKRVNEQIRLDIKKSNEQYPFFEIKEFKLSHDRFLIIDQQEVYHLGASLKDLGKKWFAFSKLEKNSMSDIIGLLSLS